MYIINGVDQEIICSKKEMDPHFNYQEIKCDECKKTLKIAQIQLKHINQYIDFVCFTYYCQEDKLTYFIFKFINRKVIYKNE